MPFALNREGERSNWQLDGSIRTGFRRMTHVMASKRELRLGRVRKLRGVRKSGPLHVTRAEFEGLIALLNERSEFINEIRRELQTQFTRIAQLQQEIDDLKKNDARGRV